MALRFNNWEQAFLQDGLHSQLKDRLEEQLNTIDNVPASTSLVSVSVKELSLGTVPPSISIAEIPFFSETRVMLYVRVDYAGDASLLITARLHTGSGEPLPLSISIESLRLRGILMVEIRQEQPGTRDISARFINDPLESVMVSSSLDRQIPFVKGLLAAHITGRLRDFLTKELPEMAKKRVDLSLLMDGMVPDEHVAAPVANSIERLAELNRASSNASSGSVGFGTIAKDYASARSTNSRGAILTKTSIKRL